MVRRRWLRRWRLAVGLVIGLSGGVLGAWALAQEDAAAEGEAVQPGAAQVKEQAWQSLLPPGSEKWDESRQREWGNRLTRARSAVREHARARERAAVRAVEVTAAQGVSPEDAEQMATAGLDEGLAPDDFEPLGKSVSAWTKQGLKGQQLAEAIHNEIRQRKEARQRAREQKRALKGAEAPQQEGLARPKGAEQAPKGGPEKPAKDDDSPGGRGQGAGRGKGRQ